MTAILSKRLTNAAECSDKNSLTERCHEYWYVNEKDEIKLCRNPKSKWRSSIMAMEIQKCIANKDKKTTSGMEAYKEQIDRTLRRTNQYSSICITKDKKNNTIRFMNKSSRQGIHPTRLFLLDNNKDYLYIRENNLKNYFACIFSIRQLSISTTDVPIPDNLKLTRTCKRLAKSGDLKSAPDPVSVRGGYIRTPNFDVYPAGESFMSSMAPDGKPLNALYLRQNSADQSTNESDRVRWKTLLDNLTYSYDTYDGNNNSNYGFLRHLSACFMENTKILFYKYQWTRSQSTSDSKLIENSKNTAQEMNRALSEENTKWIIVMSGWNGHAMLLLISPRESSRALYFFDPNGVGVPTETYPNVAAINATISYFFKNVNQQFKSIFSKKLDISSTGQVAEGSVGHLVDIFEDDSMSMHSYMRLFDIGPGICASVCSWVAFLIIINEDITQSALNKYINMRNRQWQQDGNDAAGKKRLIDVMKMVLGIDKHLHVKGDEEQLEGTMDVDKFLNNENCLIDTSQKNSYYPTDTLGLFLCDDEKWRRLQGRNTSLTNRTIARYIANLRAGNIGTQERILQVLRKMPFMTSWTETQLVLFMQYKSESCSKMAMIPTVRIHSYDGTEPTELHLTIMEDENEDNLFYESAYISHEQNIVR